MPYYIISDAHKWINEFLTFFISYPVKLLIRGRSFSSKRGKNTLLRLTLVIFVIWCVWSRISGKKFQNWNILQFIPNFFVSSIYYKLYYFDINDNDGSLTRATHMRNFSGWVHRFALIDKKFMSEYKGRSRFVLGNIWL